MFSRSGLREVWGELKKVQWPTRSQVVQGTLVVGFVTGVFAVYLNAVNFVIVRVVGQLEHFLTGH